MDICTAGVEKTGGLLRALRRQSRTMEADLGREPAKVKSCRSKFAEAKNRDVRVEDPLPKKSLTLAGPFHQ